MMRCQSYLHTVKKICRRCLTLGQNGAEVETGTVTQQLDARSAATLMKNNHCVEPYLKQN